MLKNLIVLPDGTEIFSGEGTVNALQKVTITQKVNMGRELTLGSICANMLEATLITPAGGLTIAAGTELTLYKVDDNGSRTRVGLFTTEQPTRPSANRYKITAYDRVSWLDRDMTKLLESLNGWPYKLLDIARLACNACGLTLINGAIPNGDWLVNKFSVNGITGRQLMQWVGQACGCFCRATSDGKIEFAWYTPKNISITPSGDYYTKALRFEDYQVEPIDKVQIQFNKNDIGAVYGEGSNGYAITGNYLLASDTLEPLQAVAQVIYNTLQGVTYTPCRVSIPATLEIQAGDIVNITDRNGRQLQIYVMTKIQSGQTDTLECTGSIRRDSMTALNDSKVVAVDGKILQVQASIEGLRIANQDLEGRMIAAETVISQNTEQIELRATKNEVVTSKNEAVSEANAFSDAAVGNALNAVNASIADQFALYDKTIKSRFNQTAEDINITFTKTLELQDAVDGMKQTGVSKVQTTTGYTFDETGFTVAKSGRAMKTQITEDGMTVYKNGEGVLIANNEGVDAVNLQASTYLIVGNRSRFENYGNGRTGCFWIGG